MSLRHPLTRAYVCSVLCALAAVGCGSKTEVIDTDPSVQRSGLAAEACARQGVCNAISVGALERVDLLLVMDNSNSMREEQALVNAAMPKLIDTLTTGETASGVPVPPVTDLHLGVVSTDMGLIGVEGITNCHGYGDDGILYSPPEQSCIASNSDGRFLSYQSSDDTDSAEIAEDFGCLATLGTGGCGFEQQLEAGLKALWPRNEIDPMTGAVVPNTIEFLSDDTSDAHGHGDSSNDGFLRNALTAGGDSVLAIVFVTDEEDCSAEDTSLFKPMSQLEPSDPNYGIDLNLRCMMNEDKLYAVKRYADAFRALKPGNEGRVVFAAIAGVPGHLVDAEARKGVDFSDDDERDAFYDGLLDDDRMQYTVDPSRMPGDGNIKTSCDTTAGKAYPPRRLVKVAKELGENSVVQSICADDFRPAFDEIATKISRSLRSECLKKPLKRNDDGRVSCDLVWVLPKAANAPEGTPTKCSQRDDLEKPEDRAAETKDGRAICTQHQLANAGPLFNDNAGEVSSAEFASGWLYDDNSAERARDCLDPKATRIAYAAGGRPPAGVEVFLDCD